ncbi:unnamed protein product [Colias eurytheme]|nr:unnamed protein product [Colias eurytheme]
MLMLLTVFSAVILFPCNSTTALRCRLGNYFVCGSDGFTYFNMCDFESVRSIRPNLFIRHEGRCEQSGPTERPRMSKDNGLPKRGFKAKRHHWRKSKGVGILSQILQSQIFSVAIILRYNADTAVLMCTYGEHPVCGSDGLTYTNMCDLDIARSLRPNLTMKHVGRCRDLFHTYARTYVDDDDFYLEREFYGLPKSEAARITCKYGEQILCGSDGFTYNNMCDLRIVQTVRPNLTVKHLGSCKARNGRLLNTLLKIIELQNNMVEDNALRSKKHRFSKKPHHHHHTARDDFIFNNIMSQMSKITKLNAFQMTDNAVSTQGENNLFEIDFGSNDSSLRRRMGRKFKQRKSKIF